MIIIECKLLEANTDGNEFQTGGKVSKFVNFPPRTANNYRMACADLIALAKWAGVEVPSTESLSRGSWEDIEPLIEAIESEKRNIWTKAKKRTDTGEMTVEVFLTAPKGRLGAPAASSDSEDDAPKAKRGRRS